MRAQPDAKEALDKMKALDKVQAVIEFTPDGRIVDANENFLKVMGFDSY